MAVKEKSPTIQVQGKSWLRIPIRTHIIQPEDANTPARRIYFPIMMMYLEPTEANRYYDEFVLRLNEFMGAIRSPDILKECVSLSREVMAQDYYKALTRCRKLLVYEQGLLGNVDPGLSDDGAED